MRNQAFRPRRSRRSTYRPELGWLDQRDLLSTLIGAPFTETPLVNDTIDRSQLLGPVQLGSPLTVQGDIANDADVDWFEFTLDENALLQLNLFDDADQPQAGVLSLYLGDRLLVQEVDGTLDQELLAGTYRLAVSGAGNSYFHPEMADSGGAGQTGDYQLHLAAETSAFDFSAGFGTWFSNVPTDGFASSPEKLTFGLSADIDPLGSSFMLFDSSFNDYLPSATYNADTNLLDLTPFQALPTDHYQLMIFFDTGDMILLEFDVAGVEGQAGPNDTADTAHNLGDITGQGLVRHAGVIGDDPTYQALFNPDDDPSLDVDLYRFQLSGDDWHSVAMEVFAGRVGSSLDASLSLFRIQGGVPVLVSTAHQSFNDSPTSDGNRLPLYDDSLLFADLPSGDYLLAVTNSQNALNAYLGLPGQPGEFGYYDPTVSHTSGQLGGTKGSYVLNVLARERGPAPAIVDSSIAEGDFLSGPPTEIVLQFSHPMHWSQTLEAFEAASTIGGPAGVFLRTEGGIDILLEVTSYNLADSTVRFALPGRLTDGLYELHISPALGPVNFAGRGLEPNHVSGDFVLSFGVLDSPEFQANQTVHPDGTFDSPQDLGVVFREELEVGIALTRTAGQGNADDSGDYFRFTTTADGTFSFVLSGNVPGRPVLVANVDGIETEISSPDPSSSQLLVLLPAGTYTVRISGWNAGEADLAEYTLAITQTGHNEDPTPLRLAPVAAFRVAPPTAFVGSSPPVSGETPPAPPSLGSLLTPSVVQNVTSPITPVGLTFVPPVQVERPQGNLLPLAVGPVGVVSGRVAFDLGQLAESLSLPSLETLFGMLRSDEQPVVELPVKEPEAEKPPETSMRPLLEALDRWFAVLTDVNWWDVLTQAETEEAAVAAVEEPTGGAFWTCCVALGAIGPRRQRSRSAATR